jgi:hypothetical protein
MLGLGLNNNGAALVLASSSLARMPEAALVAVLYTLVQHIVAGIVNHLNRSTSPAALSARDDLVAAPVSTSMEPNTPAGD